MTKLHGEDTRTIEINGYNYELGIEYSILSPGTDDAEIEIDSMNISRPPYGQIKMPFLPEVEEEIKQELLDAVQENVAIQGLKAYATG